MTMEYLSKQRYDEIGAALMGRKVGDPSTPTSTMPASWRISLITDFCSRLSRADDFSAPVSCDQKSI